MSPLVERDGKLSSHLKFGAAAFWPSKEHNTRHQASAEPLTRIWTLFSTAKSMSSADQGQAMPYTAAVRPAAYAMMDMPEALLTILLENMFRSDQLTHSDR